MKHQPLQVLTKFIFWSRWLQAPLYVGLIVALAVYVYEFSMALFHLVVNAPQLQETEIMLIVLDLIDVVMIANLLIMVIVGGYEVFVSRLRLTEHPDHPEWLNEVNAGTMKIKLALALIGISSIHLLRTFMDPGTKTNMDIMWQVIIHATLLISALAIAVTNKLMASTTQSKELN
jgi:uncharacterized protein (TIGR00645 family)